MLLHRYLKQIITINLIYIYHKYCACFLFACLLFYDITTILQLYHGSDMMYKMRRKKPEPTPLLSQGMFNLLHHIGMASKELTFDDAVSDI